jgi:hypothetical protein
LVVTAMVGDGLTRASEAARKAMVPDPGKVEARDGSAARRPPTSRERCENSGARPRWARRDASTIVQVG